MLAWAVVFLIVAIVSASFGFSGIAQDSAHLARILAAIGIVLAVVSFLSHRRSRRG